MSADNPPRDADQPFRFNRLRMGNTLQRGIHFVVNPYNMVTVSLSEGVEVTAIVQCALIYDTHTL